MRIVLIQWGNRAASLLLLVADFAWACRVALTGLILGCLVLAVPTQVHDLLRSVAAGTFSLKVCFWVGAFAWAVTIHSSARFSLSVDFGRRFNPHERTIARHPRITKWLPRALGLASFVGIGWALYMAMVLPDKYLPGYWGMMTITVLLGVEFFILVRFRRPLGLLMRDIPAALREGRTKLTIDWKDKDLRVYGSKRAYAVDLSPPSEPRSPRQMIMAVYERLGLFFTLILVFVAGLPLIAAMADLVWFGRFLGPSLILFLVLSSWIPLITVLAFLADWRRLPFVFAALLLFPLAWVLYGDPHDIRRIAGQERPSLVQAVEWWTRSERSPDVQSMGQGQEATPRPLLIVATAGGGSRAAFWTATVLGALADSTPDFRQNLFAISGVSGGAYGAAIVSALLQQQDIRCRDDEATGAVSTSFRRCAQLVAGEDVLSPAIAALAYREGLFPIVGLVTKGSFQDRATTIEQAMQRAWKDRMAEERQDQPSFVTAFTKFGPRRDAWAPILLMNGSSVETGRRIVTSHVRFSGAWPLGAGSCSPALALADAYDFHELLLLRRSETANPGTKQSVPCEAGGESDVSLATSVTNSARFPYVLPPGTIRDAEDNMIGRIVDGGYIENFGALTALELVRAVRAQLGSTPSVKIVVLLISSDPDLDPLGTTPRLRAVNEPSLLDQLGGPPSAIYNARVARGTLAALALHDEVREAGSFFHLRMFPDGIGIPLGWMLSGRAQEAINSQLCQRGETSASLGNGLDATEDNRQQLEGLLASLALPKQAVDKRMQELCPDRTE